MATRTVRWRRIVYALGIIAVLAFILMVRIVLLPFIFSLLLVYLINPLIVRLEQYGFKRLWLVWFLSISLLALALLFLLYAWPVIEEKLVLFVDCLPGLMMKLDEMTSNGQERLDKIFCGHPLVDLVLGKFEFFFSKSVEKLSNNFKLIFSRFLSILLAPLLAFYFLRDWEKIGQTIASYFPQKKRGELIGFVAELDSVLGAFIRGQFLASLIVGILSMIGLLILRVRAPLALGFIAGITNIIPYFGPFIGAIPALLVVLVTNPSKLLMVLALFLIIQQSESLFISPYIFTSTLGLHPLVIIFSVLAGGYLLGFWGLLVAVPVAGALKIFVKHLKPFLLSE